MNRWTAMNDVEVAWDNVMYWAIFEYLPMVDGALTPGVQKLTNYDLTNEQAWDVVESHNTLYGFDD